MRTAIFGGSFNPVHNEHIQIVKAAISELQLDRVIILPSNITPFKDGRMVASGNDRLKMCKLAFREVNCAEVSDYEIARGGVSYSYLTCRAFREKFPEDKLYFIIGADMLEDFVNWMKPEEILKDVELAVCARVNGQSLTRAENIFKFNFANVEFEKFSYVGKNVSSTEIRILAALGEPIKQYVGDEVADYIVGNNLYKFKSFNGNVGLVRQLMTQSRWEHTVRVALTAAKNCPRFKIPEEKAVTAALLHDCAKYLDKESTLLDGFEWRDDVPPPVIHQYTGAYVAEKTFGVSDAEIIDAIRYHTSGKAKMSALGKLLYLSDMLEDGRTFCGVDDLRKAFLHDIDEGMKAALEFQIKYLKSSGAPIYPITEEAFNYYKNN